MLLLVYSPPYIKRTYVHVYLSEKSFYKLTDEYKPKKENNFQTVPMGMTDRFLGKTSLISCTPFAQNYECVFFYAFFASLHAFILFSPRNTSKCQSYPFELEKKKLYRCFIHVKADLWRGYGSKNATKERPFQHHSFPLQNVNAVNLFTIKKMKDEEPASKKMDKTVERKSRTILLFRRATCDSKIPS